MKKLFAIAVLMALTMNGFADQILHYDFSAVCETGQTLYYLITNEDEHTVTLTYPESEENQGFMGDYYSGHPIPQGEIILPSIVEHDGIQYFVTAIDNHAFDNCSDLVGTLTIPEGIVSIGGSAFYNCSFTSIFISRTVEEIAYLPYGEGSAFGYCGLLESITVDGENPTFYSENNAIIKREGKILVQGCKTTLIPDDIETIGNYAFYGTGDGGNLVIPNSVTSINEYAFYYCKFSGTITFSDSLRHIGACAFLWSHFSGSLTLPDSVTEIGGSAFCNCGHLTGNLTLPSSLSEISGHAFSGVGCTGSLIIPNSVRIIGQTAFFYTNFSELVLGNSVETIGFKAFSNSHSSIHLSGILRLPTSLTEIGWEAFTYTSFDEIYSPNTTPPTIQNNNAFDNCDHDIPVHIPLGCTEIYQNTSGWNYFTNFIETEMNLEGEWYYEILNDDGSITYQYLQCTGDTTINSQRAKIVVCTNQIYDKKGQIETSREYLFEHEGVVYWWNKKLQEFTVLYNFAAEVGDEWEIKVGTERIVMHVDAVSNDEYDGKTYRMLHVSDPDHLFSGDIVCGVGHLTSFFPEKLMNQDKGYRVEGLRCFWQDENLVFQHGGKDCDEVYEQHHHGLDETPMASFQIYPNPTDGLLHVETVCTPSLPMEYRITNLLGQTLLTGSSPQIDVSPLPAGLYFINFGHQTLKFTKQ